MQLSSFIQVVGGECYLTYLKGFHPFKWRLPSGDCGEFLLSIITSIHPFVLIFVIWNWFGCFTIVLLQRICLGFIIWYQSRGYRRAEVRLSILVIFHFRLVVRIFVYRSII